MNTSLIMTAHRRNYLLEALLSVAAQTTCNFEFVLCLDTAIDSGLQEYVRPLFEHISLREKRIVTVHGNGTAGFCRNEAFRNASGQWLAYMDGDDLLAPDAMKVMMQYQRQEPSIDIFSSGMARIGQTGVVTELEKSLTYYPPIDIYDVDPEVVGESTFFNQFQLMRRSVWEQYPYDDSTNGEDIDFMLVNLLRWRFRKVPQYLYYYRDLADSFSKITYAEGDFTSQRYRSGFYHDYFKKNYCDRYAGNFDYNAYKRN